MKRCPTCQKEFPDSMRFCQTDGTPLLDPVEQTPPEDPFKTMVAPPISAPTGGQDDPMKTMVVSADSKDDDILQIPEVFDPMKTVVVSDEVKRSVPPKPPVNEPVINAPDPPKFSEPNLSPPNFGDLSGSSNEPIKPIDPPRMDSPISSPFNDPPKVDSAFGSSFNDPPKVDNPISSPFNDPPKFEPPPLPKQEAPTNSPFNQPLNEPFSKPFDTPTPPFKEPSFNNPPPFEDSPFNQPANNQFNQPVQQNDWNPPPAPVSNWQEQGIGANTPFTPPPVGAGGINQTLPIVSLVLGIVAICCPLGVLAGGGALITGFLGMKNVKNDPAQYGGKNLALAGMIVGGIFFVLSLIWWLLQILGIAAGSFSRF